MMHCTTKCSILASTLLLARHAYATVQTFMSTNIRAEVIDVVRSGAPSAGRYWLQPHGPAGGPTIYESNGQLIWRDNTGAIGNNFDLQTYDGQRYSTYWDGDNTGTNGHGYGFVVMLDNMYQKKYTVCVTDNNVTRFPSGPMTTNCQADYHESRITPSGTMLVTGRTLTQRDLRYLNGPRDAWLLDCPFYEVDIPTSKTLFRWSPLDHLDQFDSLAASQFRLPPGNNGTSKLEAWDYFHLNSVASVPAPMEGYILSSRPLSAIFKLDKRGNIEWVVGVSVMSAACSNRDANDSQGRTGGNFTVPAEAKFQYQHDAEVISFTGNTLTFSIFDNFSADRRKNQGPSSGKILEVNIATKSVRLVKIFQGANAPMSQHGGGFDLLPNGGVVVSYGGTKIVKEYGPGGKIVNTLTLTDGSSYRANKRIGYVGTPAAPPDAVAVYSQAKDQTTIYMSWNGATEVASWRVNSKTVPKAGFETVMTVAGVVNNFVVEALGKGGNVLRRSNTVTTRNAGNAGRANDGQPATDSPADAAASTSSTETATSTLADAATTTTGAASTSTADAVLPSPTNIIELVGPVEASNILLPGDGPANAPLLL